MVTLTVAPFRGNAQRSHFPLSGYMGVTPVFVQGVVETALEEDGQVLQASSLTVSVVCTESISSAAGVTDSRELLRVSHVPWSTPDGAFAPLGNFRAPFRIHVDPVDMTHIFSSCEQHRYSRVWTIEARIAHKPSALLGASLGTSQRLRIERYYNRNTLVTPLAGASAFSGRLIAGARVLPYTASLNAGSYGPGDPFRLVLVPAAGISLRKLVVTLHRRVALASRAPKDAQLATFDADGPEVVGTFPESPSTHHYSIGETATTPLCQMSFHLTLRATATDGTVYTDAGPHPLLVTATTHSATLAALSAYEKKIGQSLAEFRLFAYPILNENGLSHIISATGRPARELARGVSAERLTTARRGVSAERLTTARPRGLSSSPPDACELLARGSERAPGAEPPRNSPRLLSRASFGDEPQRVGDESRRGLSDESRRAVSSELPDASRFADRAVRAAPTGRPRTAGAHPSTAAGPAPLPGSFSRARTSIGSQTSGAAHAPPSYEATLKRPHTSSGLPSQREFGFGGDTFPFGTAAFAYAHNPFKHRAPPDAAELPPTPQSAYLHANASGSTIDESEESSKISDSTLSSSGGTKYLSTPPRTPLDVPDSKLMARADATPRKDATPGPSLNMLFLSIDDARNGAAVESSDVSSTLSRASNSSDSTLKPGDRYARSPFFFDDDDMLKRVNDVYYGKRAPTKSASDLALPASTPPPPYTSTTMHAHTDSTELLGTPPGAFSIATLSNHGSSDSVASKTRNINNGAFRKSKALREQQQQQAQNAPVPATKKKGLFSISKRH